MDITSLKFTVFSLLSVFVFYILNPRVRIGYLAIISCGFIAAFNYYLLIYVVIYSFINYVLGMTIHKTKHKKTLFRSGLVLNLTQLVTLKYASFAIDPIFQIFNNPLHISKLSEILVPVGVSYFTLQGIGYLINVKMNWEKPEMNFMRFFLYIIFYPKFISGPIERSNNFLPQLDNLDSFNRENVSEGFRLILEGLIRKVVIANQLSLIVNPVYNDIGSAKGAMLMLVIIVQPLFLYFDFSGYTNIALGIAKAFGINLLPNFNRPFFSENVTTFWRRFHMSLSLWFNDYIFKQASFRFRKWRKYASVVAVLITWILFGIWHGAGWNFMVLGLIQAIAINFEFFTKRQRTVLFSKISPFWRKWTGRAITYLFFGVSLVFFFSSDLKTAFLFFDRLNNVNFSIPANNESVIIVDKISFFAACAIMVIVLLAEWLSCDHVNAYRSIEGAWNSNKIGFRFLRLTTYYLAFLLFFYYGGMQTEFVYFQF